MMVTGMNKRKMIILEYEDARDNNYELGMDI